MLYERIKELCRQKGVSIAQMEREIGFPRSSISKIDKHTPSMDKIQKIADYFDVSVDSLVDESPELKERRAFTIEMTHYIDEMAARITQNVFDNPDLRLLFDAAEGSRPEDIRMAADLLTRLKERRFDV